VANGTDSSVSVVLRGMQCFKQRWPCGDTSHWSHLQVVSIRFWYAVHTVQALGRFCLLAVAGICCGTWTCFFIWKVAESPPADILPLLTLWCHIFNIVSGLCTLACSYSYIFPSSVCSWFAGSIPDGVAGIFHWHNPSGRTMTLWLTQPLTEMSTRNISWGGGASM
jgi:hypothetical protein